MTYDELEEHIAKILTAYLEYPSLSIPDMVRILVEKIKKEGLHDLKIKEL